MKQTTKQYICTGPPENIAQIEMFLNELVEQGDIEYIKQDADLQNIKIVKTQHPETDENAKLPVSKYKPGEFKVGDTVKVVDMKGLHDETDGEFMQKEGLTIGSIVQIDLIREVTYRGYSVVKIKDGLNWSLLATNFVKIDV